MPAPDEDVRGRVAPPGDLAIRPEARHGLVKRLNVRVKLGVVLRRAQPPRQRGTKPATAPAKASARITAFVHTGAGGYATQLSNQG